MTNVVAIDVSKDKSSFCVLNTQNEFKKADEFPMTKTGFRNLLSQTGRLKEPAFFMESTGRYHLTLLKFLLNHGKDTFIVNPVLVKNFSKANTLRKTKTDKVDARLIADFANNNSCKLKKAEYGLTEEIRALARRREQLSEEVARAKTQLKADLTVAFPEILSLNVFTDCMLRFIAQYPSAQAVLAAGKQAIVESLTSEGRGRSLNTPVEVIISKAADSIGIDSYGPLVFDSVNALLALKEREKAFTDTLLSYMNKHHRADMEILESIPGVGKITASHFIAEIGDIHKYERYQNLIAYCGTDPGLYQSGNIYRQGHITKHGNSSLRRYVYLMASGVKTYNPYFRAYYDKKRAEGFPHRKAMVALMNKLMKTIFALLTKGETFIMPN